MTMMPEDVTFFSDLIKKRSGILLGTEKIYLIESRLQPIYRARGMNSLAELMTALRLRPTEDLLKDVLEAMTTNETSFFRDGKPFEQLKTTVFPALREKRAITKTIRIWSAACSSGQEVYSIAMTALEENTKTPGWHYQLVATDIAQKVIDKAQDGIFSQFEVQRGLPIQYLMKYFSQLPDNQWQLKQDVRSMVQFRLVNLMENFTAQMGVFDVIFCRNVLIYFDEATKAQVLTRLHQCLAPDGVLYLGSAETTIGITDKFKLMDAERGLYTRAA